MNVNGLNYELKGFLETYFNEERGKGRLPGLHPSEISAEHFCFRKDKLHQTNKKEDLGWGYSLETKLIFEAGHAAHEYVRNEWLGPWGKLIGFWDKPGEKSVYGKQPDVTWKFREESIEIPNPEDPTNSVVGHIDGILELDGEKYILDVKTMYIKGFYFTKRVSERYKNQLHFYMKALDIKKALILYICKTNYQPKFLEISFDEDKYKMLVDRGDEVVRTRKVDELPDMLKKCTPSSSIRTFCMFNCACPHLESLDQFRNTTPQEWDIKNIEIEREKQNKNNLKFNSIYL